MGFRSYKKFLSAFLIVPMAALFLACCCLKADAAFVKKSNCASCPQQKDSKPPADCPHAKIKAVLADDFASIKVIKPVFVSMIFIDLSRLVLVQQSNLFSFLQIDTSGRHFSLFPQNPVLRL